MCLNYFQQLCQQYKCDCSTYAQMCLPALTCNCETLNWQNAGQEDAVSPMPGLSAAHSGWKLILLFLFPPAPSLSPCLVSGLISSPSSSLALLFAHAEEHSAACTGSWWRWEARPTSPFIRDGLRQELSNPVAHLICVVNYKDVGIIAGTDLQKTVPAGFECSYPSPCHQSFPSVGIYAEFLHVPTSTSTDYLPMPSMQFWLRWGWLY